MPMDRTELLAFELRRATPNRVRILRYLSQCYGIKTRTKEGQYTIRTNEGSDHERTSRPTRMSIRPVTVLSTVSTWGAPVRSQAEG